MMQTMTACSFGDIVLVPFPFTNQSAIKKRPTVIISSDEYYLLRNTESSNGLGYEVLSAELVEIKGV